MILQIHCEFARIRIFPGPSGLCMICPCSDYDICSSRRLNQLCPACSHEQDVAEYQSLLHAAAKLSQSIAAISMPGEVGGEGECGGGEGEGEGEGGNVNDDNWVLVAYDGTADQDDELRLQGDKYNPSQNSGGVPLDEEEGSDGDDEEEEQEEQEDDGVTESVAVETVSSNTSSEGIVHSGDGITDDANETGGDAEDDEDEDEARTKADVELLRWLDGLQSDA